MVVLLDRQEEQQISADDLVGLMRTIAYKIVARIRSGLPRLLVERDAPRLPVVPHTEDHRCFAA